MQDDLRVYRLWIQYLAESDSAAWTPEVREDFKGAVEALRDGTNALDQWIFQANYDRALFFDASAVVPTVVELSQAGELIIGRQLAVVLDLTQKDDDLAAGVIAYAGIYRDQWSIVRESGRPKFEAEPAKYKLASRPDLEALEAALYVHQRISADPALKLYRLGQSMIGTHGIAPRWRHEPDGADRRRELSNIVSRLKTRAEAVIGGVCGGVFPIQRTT